MFISPWLSSYILSGVVHGGIIAALLATGASDISLSLVSVDQFPLATTNVDRSLKSDRLPVTRADSVTNTTTILKNVRAPQRTVPGASVTPARPRTLEIDDGERAPKLAPAPPLPCETMASSVSDPNMSHLISRCFV